MKMRALLNIAMPFMRHSGGTAIVMNRELTVGATSTGHGKALYGLPCARCGAYYAAELGSCPVCNSTERTFSKPKPTAWPAVAPRSKAVPPMQEENPSSLASINQELLSARCIIEAMTVSATTETMSAPA